ncbi:hypothetical protein HGA64_02720, partial [Candidatus Falkowbacteria bacterium]|nr:hypothetical protein [Candidatus Falkowbacteria bacterium]
MSQKQCCKSAFEGDAGGISMTISLSEKTGTGCLCGSSGVIKLSLKYILEINKDTPAVVRLQGQRGEVRPLDSLKSDVA